MKHKRQTLSKTDEEDDNKGDEDSQPCSKSDRILFMLAVFSSNVIGVCAVRVCLCAFLTNRKTAFQRRIIFYFLIENTIHIEDALSPDSSSKKSCQGCELPSDDIPDSTSNSRGHNNNTPSATNNNNKSLGNGKKYFICGHQSKKSPKISLTFI